VGIGTSAPLQAASISGTTTFTLGLNDPTPVSTNVGASIILSGNTAGNGLAVIKSGFSGAATTDGGYLALQTRAVSSGVLTERLRITSAGNVGIGTSSPSAAGSGYGALDIRGLGGGGVRYGVSSGFNMLTYATGSEVDFVTSAAGAIRFFNKTATGESMRITSTGNVGIGLTAPSRRLSVQNSGVNTEGIALYRNTGDGTLMVGLAQDADGHGELLINNTSGVRNVQLRSNGNSYINAGNVGIGTSAPNASAILDVQSTTKGVRMPNMTTTQKNAISSPAAGLMVYDTTLAKLCVYTTAWETITSL
jgi:hypothetical protein